MYSALKKVINTQFKQLEPLFCEVLKGNYTPDIVFCNKRNVVEKVTLAGESYVVKRYKSPNFINKIAYRFFRKSKARRAYEYALRLLDAGVDTPFPVAYFEIYEKRLFKQGVFISKFVEYDLLENIFNDVPNAADRKIILNDFIDFLLEIHKRGVVPMDLNAGNVFYYKNEGELHYNFALTDINRMKFNTVPGESDVMRSLEQCFYPIDELFELVSLYSDKVDTKEIYEIIYSVLHLRIKRRKKNRFKRKLRSCLNF